jgi:hypothetical protein
MVRRSVPLAQALSAHSAPGLTLRANSNLPPRCARYLLRSDGSTRATAPAPLVAASSFWTPADPLGHGFEARPLRRRQDQALAHAPQAQEKLAVPTAEARLMLREFIDPLPGGHTVALPGTCAPLSRSPVIAPGLMTSGF